MDFSLWLTRFTSAMEEAFGSRIVFLGIQGSRGRGEATEESDIDVVVILDQVDFATLKRYDEAVSRLPARELLCGFVSGRDELLCWNRAELFQFYHDTTPLAGSLNFLLPLIRPEDVRRAIHCSACTVYHLCSHNFLHAKSPAVLKDICKMGFFLLQARHYEQTGDYLNTKAGLYAVLPPEERVILDGSRNAAEGREAFDQLSEQVLNWSKALILAYG